MRALARILIYPIKANKAYFLFLLLLVIGCFVYAIFSHSLIESMYEGRSLNALNNLIQYQHKYSLEHYLELADFLFIRMLFLLFSLGSFVYLLCMLVFSARKVSPFWPILLFTTILILVYVLNPNHRVYSYHGFYRAGIVYQILNGSVPPTDCLFAGETLRTPWGYAFLTACITWIINLTPFYSFAILNIISLLLVTYLVYRISSLLINNPRANVFSVLISILGITIFSNSLILALSRHLHFIIEPRATPCFQKFFNVNGVPVGLVFFFLFLYSLIRILGNSKVGLNGVYFFIAVLGCGFFYPPIFPGIIVGVTAVCLVFLILMKRKLVTINFRRIMLIAGTLLVILLLLSPYWLTISSGVKGGVELAKIVFVARNAIVFSFLSIPILVVIIINREFLWSQLNRQPLIIISIIIAANALIFVFIHIPFELEYKYLILSTTTLGILGGISFNFLRQRFNKTAVFLVLLLFFIPPGEIIYISLTNLAKVPITYVEKGKYIYSRDEEKNELYEWIRQNTPIDSVFIDRELTIPIFAQRSLFIGTDKTDWSTIGYGIKVDDFLKMKHGYGADLMEKRRSIVKQIYNLPHGANNTEAEEYFNTHDNVYIVARKNVSANKFEQIDFYEVFRSSRDNYHVFQRK